MLIMCLAIDDTSAKLTEVNIIKTDYFLIKYLLDIFVEPLQALHIIFANRQCGIMKLFAKKNISFESTGMMLIYIRLHYFCFCWHFAKFEGLIQKIICLK